MLKNAAVAVGIEENINTHSLRKIWGWNVWINGYSPALIMDTLNHYNLEVTRRYLGIRQDEINNLYENLNI
ncbi:tyrosine-type recombinase/integrase [Lutibacter sp. B2]|nr:tyrosine-type recombinase/integrase [Lutibacter sp. B2]